MSETVTAVPFGTIKTGEKLPCGQSFPTSFKDTRCPGAGRLQATDESAQRHARRLSGEGRAGARLPVARAKKIKL